MSAEPADNDVSGALLQRLEQHLALHGGALLSQRRFNRLRLSIHHGTPPHIVIEGQVARLEDFTAVKAEWNETKPPCPTSIFVHIDPPGPVAADGARS